MPEPTTIRQLAVAFCDRIAELGRAHVAAVSAGETLQEHVDAEATGIARWGFAVVTEVRGIREQLENCDPIAVHVDAASLIELVDLANEEPAVPETAGEPVGA